jgi:hypothetical protein
VVIAPLEEAVEVGVAARGLGTVNAPCAVTAQETDADTRIDVERPELALATAEAFARRPDPTTRSPFAVAPATALDASRIAVVSPEEAAETVDTLEARRTSVLIAPEEATTALA